MGNWLKVAFRLARENVKLTVGRGKTPEGNCPNLKDFPGTVMSMNAGGDKICPVGCFPSESANP
jgi:hypothetical protein